MEKNRWDATIIVTMYPKSTTSMIPTVMRSNQIMIWNFLALFYDRVSFHPVRRMMMAQRMAYAPAMAPVQGPVYQAPVPSQAQVYEAPVPAQAQVYEAPAPAQAPVYEAMTQVLPPGKYRIFEISPFTEEVAAPAAVDAVAPEVVETVPASFDYGR